MRAEAGTAKAESRRGSEASPIGTRTRAGWLQRIRRSILHPSSLILLLCLPALWPMLSLSSWASHDGLHHIFRIASFDAGVRSGVLYPRWADQLGFGYGFPVTHYYAPLAYGAAELFHLGSAGILDSIKLVYAVSFIVSALGMYYLARSLVGTRSALLAAIAFAYYPYHLADIYMRGTLTEFAALALLPWIVLAVRSWLLEAGEPGVKPGLWRRIPVRFAILLAALILTHNLTAFLFLPVLAFYAVAVALGKAGERLRMLQNMLSRLAAGTLLALALSAFYWLPALSEVSWIRAGQISGSVEDIPSLLTPLGQFVATSLLQPYIPDAPAGLQHPLGLAVALLSVAALLAAIVWRKQLTADQRGEWWAWLLIAAGTSFAMLDLSAPLWSAIQPLAFVQYPYRLHAVLGLALAILIAIGAEATSKRVEASSEQPGERTAAWAGPLRTMAFPQIANAASVGVMLLLIAAALGALSLVPQTLPGHKEPISEAEVNIVGMSEYDYQTALWARLYGGPWLLEYLPAWVTAAREDFFLPSSAPASDVTVPASATVSVADARPEQRVVRVQSAAPFRLSFHTFYFPAWQVRVDGIPVPTFPAGPLALVSADVPAGNHAVALDFEGTTLQGAGEVIALLALFALAVWFSLSSRHRKLWLSGALLLLAGVLGWRSLDMQAGDAPQPVTATFDSRIDLAGYSVAQSEVPPGGVVDLTLYWFVREAPHEDFKVFVHVDGAGGRAGQADSQPGLNFSPMTRWQRGELIADHYRVKIAANAAPGAYDMYAGIYRSQPLQDLPVVSPNATAGNGVRLGKITVAGNQPSD